jgi:hypothetical protein
MDNNIVTSFFSSLGQPQATPGLQSNNVVSEFFGSIKPTTRKTVQPVLKPQPQPNIIQKAINYINPPMVSPLPDEKPKSFLQKLDEVIAEKLNKVREVKSKNIIPGGLKGAKERITSIPLKEYVLPLATKAEPVRQYGKNALESAVNSITGIAKFTPAYMTARAAINKPVSAREYLGNLINTPLSIFSTAWHLNPEAPAFGAIMGELKTLRKKYQEKGVNIGWNDLADVIEGATKGIGEQPGVGSVITDNVELAQKIDTVFMAAMFAKPIISKKIRKIGIKPLPEKVTEVSKVSVEETMNKQSEAYQKAPYAKADTRINDLIKTSETLEGKQIAQQRLQTAIQNEQIKPDKDGKITVYRVGEPKTDYYSVTYNEQSAKTIQAERKALLHKEEPITSQKISPDQIVTFIGDVDKELVIKSPSSKGVGEVTKPVIKPVINEAKPVIKPNIETISKEQIANSKTIKDIKTSLRNIKTEYTNLITEAEGKSVLAQEQRSGLNTNDINTLKRIYNKSEKFQAGDIETIRASSSKDLVNRVIENVQEKYPEMSEQEAFDYAIKLPTKAQEAVKPDIKGLTEKEKVLKKYLEVLDKKQKELTNKLATQKENEIYNEWKEVIVAQEQLARIIEVPREQLPVGEGKVKVSRLEARVKKALDDTSPETIEKLGLTTYNQMVRKETIKQAVEYVTSNPEEAIKVLTGDAQAPKGLPRNSIYVAMENMAKDDLELARKLATLSSTRYGQEINILKEIDPNSPVKRINDIIQIKEESFQKKYKGQTVKSVKDKVVRQIKDSVKKVDKYDWNKFIDSIDTC